MQVLGDGDFPSGVVPRQMFYPVDGFTTASQGKYVKQSTFE